MIKNKLIYTLIILFLLSLNSCGSVKNAVTAKKRSEQSDEFLVQKKNPLTMPPDYAELPVPGNQEVSPETFTSDNEVKDLLNIEGDNTSNSNNNDNSSDLESSIIKKIK